MMRLKNTWVMMMTDLGWECPACKDWNSVGSKQCVCGYSLNKNTQKAAKATKLSIIDTHAPVKLKKRGRGKWSYLGLPFDSSDEAWRYGYLLSMKAAGIIRHLFVQPTMVIRPAFQLTAPGYVNMKSGKPRTIPAETYTPDYAYVYGDLLVIEDVKGLSKGKPYSKRGSDRSQKHLMHRYRNHDNVLFMLVTGKQDSWRYWQASHGYPELDFELVADSKEKAA